MNLTLTSNHITFIEFGSDNIASNPPTIAATISNGSQTYYGQAKSDNPAIAPAFQLTGSTSANIKPILSPGFLSSPTGAGEITVEVCKDNVCGDIVTSQVITYTYAIYSVPTYIPIFGATSGTVQTMTVPITPTPPATDHFRVANSSNSAWLTTSIVNDVVQISADPSSLASGVYYGTVLVTGLGSSITIHVAFSVQ